MAWEKASHTKCMKPLLAAAFASDGQVWRCDEPGCGKRWRLNKHRDSSGVLTHTTWTLL